MGMVIPMAMANYEYISAITGDTGRANAVVFATEAEDLDEITRIATAVEDHFKRIGMTVYGVGTMGKELAEADAAFGLVTSLMLIMALLLAVVGGLGLMGTMSINVLERTREIGVLRAIGAPNKGVSQVFILEGIVIGLMSWGLGSVLAVPLSKLFSDAIGYPMLGMPLIFKFSLTGVWVWMALVILLSALASLVPARNASRLTVREILAYE
jgi:putative ABC transport system permease protein